MPSLRELQSRFAAAVLAADGTAPTLALADARSGAERIGIYRRTIRTNYRNALGATYPVVRRVGGAPFFAAAVDAYVEVHPSRCGDLNVYGATFGEFLGAYEPASRLAYLPDVARLEWAMDEAARAADAAVSAEATVAALSTLGPEELICQRLALDASCRLLRSEFPILRIFQAHRADGDFAIDFDVPAEHLLVRRDGASPVVERLAPAEYEWLAALGAGHTLGVALESAFACDAQFDAGAALGKHIGNGTIHAA